MWLLEEAFRGDGEEFRRICGAVFTEDSFMTRFAVLPQALVIGTQNARPYEISIVPFADAVSRQQWSAINHSVLLVELVGKFVQNQV